MEYPKELTAKTIAQVLENVAAAYKIKGEDFFRIRAYENAAAAIRHSGEDIKQLWQQGKLEEIPGIGPNIAQHLDELFRTGKVKHFDQVTKGLPDGMFELLKVPRIGPKTAYKLAKKFHLNRAQTAIEELKKYAARGKIRELPSFGEEKEKDIRESVESFTLRPPERLLLVEAQKYADEVINYMRRSRSCEQIEALGSLRRQAPTIGDVDLAATSKIPAKCMAAFVAYPKVKEVLASGENTARILITNNVQIDLKIVPQEVFGSLLQHFTGSKQHNILLREYAIGKGYSLSEYGIKKIKDQSASWRTKIKNLNQKAENFRFTDEKKFYNFLGLNWIPPELREGTNEIEVSLAKKLPQLIELKQIKGDLHVHSNIHIETSHDEGESSLGQLAAAAGNLDYEYLGISDHNPRTSEITEKKVLEVLRRRKEDIDKFNYSSENNVNKRGKKLYMFHALEVDIKPDGSLALPEKAFPMFDFLIASVHSSFRQDKKKMTDRIIRALEFPKVKILGHPTGRMLEQREGFELDWERIFAICKKKEIFLEINAWPQRLDLPEHLVREAIKAGVKCIINTDSHAASQLSLMRFGVAVARRGWAEAHDIINTLPLKKFKSIMEID